jgi:tetrahydromethanopterin S-methyltransferase subunit F
LCIAPLYVLAVVTAIELTLARAYKHVSADPLNPNYLRGAQIAIVVSAIAFVAVHPENYHPEIYPRVPTADKFVEFLQSKLGGRDKSFKGSVMTYTGNPADAGEMLAYDRTVAQSVGNAHRAQMLWYFDIPTLDEYNDLMTPAKYVFLTRMFANRYEHQSRNLLVLNRIHPPALAAAGVRYVIADKAVDSPSMSQVEQMMIPNIGEHRIYELKNVNVGSYSPTDIVRVADTAEAVEAMLARDFDFQRSAVVAEADGRDSRLARLVVADTSNFAMGRHGYILTAKTNAASLIVLPIAFSNCLIATDKRLAPASKIMRIDGALTGVLFSGTIDVRIRPATPFFERPFCNIQDWLAFKNLGPKFSNLWGD